LAAILIDSDVLIEGKDQGLLAQWDELSSSDCVIECSPVTVAELWHGARSHEHRLLEALFQVISCVPIDAEIGRRAGDYLRQFSRSHSVELGDALIAATAATHGLSLWTRNRKHYPMKDCAFFR
jgi:predicted nucleic acid-binding protein